MQLDDDLAAVRRQLEAVAALGDERAQEVAAAVATAAGPAVRLAVLNALAAAAEEATAALLDYPGSPVVSVRLDRDEVHVEVQAAAPAEPPAPARADDADASARISLRLAESLKGDVEAAAARDGVSVNTWLVRAAEAALQPTWPGARWDRWAEPGTGRHITGWING